MTADRSQRVDTVGFRRTVALLWYFYRHHLPLTAAIVVMLIGAGFLENVGILALLPAIQMLTAEAKSSAIGAYLDKALALVGLQATFGTILVLSLAAVAFKVGLSQLCGQLNARLVADMIARLRTDIIDGLLRAEWQHFKRVNSGRYVNLLSAEADRVVPALNQGIGFTADIVHVALYLVSAFTVSAPIALLAIVFGGLKVVAMRPLLSIARRSGMRQSSHSAALGSHIVETIDMAKSIKAMSREAQAESRLVEDVTALRAAQIRNQLGALWMNGIDEFLITVVVVASFFIAVTFLNADLAQIAIVGVLMSRTMSKIGILQKRYYTAISNSPALAELIGTSEELRGLREREPAGVVPTLNAEISISNLHLSHDGNPVISGMDLRIPSRSLTVIRGPSGSGKTTFVDALIGFVPIQFGSIAVDGVDLRDIDLTAWRNSIGYVPQETTLVHGSVLENVALYAGHVAEADVIAALDAAEANDFVRRLPQGVHSFVGERGSMLSGGQRQRLAIARALLRKPQLLILDEATTALDTATEAEICKTLKHLSRNLTIVAISHQPAILDVADKVFDMGDVSTMADPGEKV
jgi:ATP-binding cassette subfamily C protein